MMKKRMMAELAQLAAAHENITDYADLRFMGWRAKRIGWATSA
jgi:hypothetical protein